MGENNHQLCIHSEMLNLAVTAQQRDLQSLWIQGFRLISQNQ